METIEAQPPTLRTAADAARFFEARLADSARESLLVAHLDAGRRLIHLARETGSAGHVALPVRPIIADAIRFESAGLILAHFHPSGDAEPSDADIAATRKLQEMGAGLALRLHDHLIFAGGQCRSLRALGLL